MTGATGRNVFARAWSLYKLRWRRRRFLYRAYRKRRELSVRVDRTDRIQPSDILLCITVRNEALRLPYFLAHCRRLGVGHILAVDNGSDDGTAEMLADQDDVSLWTTDASYRGSRFGVDWLTWLLLRYAHGHWVLTLDADEIFIYPDWETRPLQELTGWLDQRGVEGMGALMLDMIPEGSVADGAYAPGDDPITHLTHFDPGPFRATRQMPRENLWMQGGLRERVFFADCPHRSPTLNKIPLVKWRRPYVYVNSTHSLLPPRLNHLYDGLDCAQISGVLLHTKFLPDAVTRAREERQRKEHFNDPAPFDSYYDAIIQNPKLAGPTSVKYEGWRQLQKLGLMSRGNWP